MSEQPDPLLILDAFEPIREMWRGLVAAVIADGFTEEQARALVVTGCTGWRFNDDGSGGLA